MYQDFNRDFYVKHNTWITAVPSARTQTCPVTD